jgi:glycosyltransferase involved in cell wall biosynthesis
MPRASIIIPTYNRSAFLETAVASALAQTVQDIEVIIVDDGSTDDTAAAIDGMSDSRITPVRHPTNQGLASALLTGLDWVKAEFVTLLSDDDAIMPSFIAHRLSAFEQAEHVDIVFSRYRIGCTTGEHITSVGLGFSEQQILDPPALLAAALASKIFVGTGLYRRDALLHLPDRVTGPRNAIDHSITIEVALNGGSAVFLPVEDYVYLDHEDQAKYTMGEGTAFKLKEQYLQRTLGERADLSRLSVRLIRRELSNWHTAWGCRLRSEGRTREARFHFRTALRIDPRNSWAWKQVIRSAALF